MPNIGEVDHLLVLAAQARRVGFSSTAGSKRAGLIW